MQRLKAFIESRRFEGTITALIFINAVTLGLETSEAAMAAAGPLLVAIDRIILGVFVLELAARFTVLLPATLLGLYCLWSMHLSLGGISRRAEDAMEPVIVDAEQSVGD